jgi:hypothetical protein
VNGVVTAIWPIALLIVVVIVGGPLWLIWRRRSARPDYREARAHYRAKASSATVTSDYVPTAAAPAVDGLTVARKKNVAPGDADATSVPPARTPADEDSAAPPA